MEAHTFPKGAREQVVVRRSTWRGREYVSVRVWYQNAIGKWVPSKKGIALAPRLGAAVSRAMLEASRD